MFNSIKDILKDVYLMVVEDDDSLRNVISYSLSDYVCTIYSCKSAKEAMDCFSKNNINLIVSDINMPIVNGIKMASAIRNLDQNIPIIFLTAYDSDENILSALELKSSAVIKKPFDKRELIMSISFAANKFQSEFANVDLQEGFIFNAVTRVLIKDNKIVELTKKEKSLLHLLLKNNPNMVSFEMIQNYVWCGDGCSHDAIRSFVYKLRRKLYPNLIQNCQGTGYKINFQRADERTVYNINYI